MYKKPLIQVVASRIAGLFGFYFFNLCYGEKNFLAHQELNSSTGYAHVRLATREDLDKITNLTGDVIKERFKRIISLKSTCYIAESGGDINGYLWSNRHAMVLLGMYLRKLPEKKSYIHEVFVFPEHRGKKVFQDMLHKVYHDMEKEGVHAVSCFVDKANLPSIAGFKRIGFKFRPAPILKLPGIRPFLIGRLPDETNHI